MPYKVLFIAVDSEALGGAELGQAVVAGMDVEGVNRPPTAREGAIIAAIAKTMDERNLTKAISFHSRNANAERFVQYAGAMFEARQLGISLERVDGKMPAEERGKKMETFGDASAPMIMANARCNRVCGASRHVQKVQKVSRRCPEGVQKMSRRCPEGWKRMWERLESPLQVC